MSGRSAYVRAKKVKAADNSTRSIAQDYDDDGTFIYGFSGLPIPPSTISNPSFTTGLPIRRHQSISSGGSTYCYPPPPSRKLRPIVVASAIEKSDFRTHLDGMSSTVRYTVKKLVKGKDDNNQSSAAPRPRTAFDGSSETSSAFTPSITAVPSLSPGSSPSTNQSDLPRTASDLPEHSKSDHSRSPGKNQIRRFEGGGKSPLNGWKSLANVSCGA